MRFKAIKIMIPCLLMLTSPAVYSQQAYLPAKKQQAFVLSVIDSIRSAALGETRKINLYLPEGYTAADTVQYPVIYLLDGGLEEDFIHVVGLVKYNTTPWIHRFPPSIVVGIENSDRQKDFTFAVPNLDFVNRIGFAKSDFKHYGKSSKFISFLEKELQPFMAGNYKISTSKTLIGESLAGLLATEVLLTKPKLFDTYIIINPSLWWGKESLLSAAEGLLQTHKPQQLKVYIGACDKAESRIMYKDARNLALLLKKYKNGKIRVNFDYMPYETHATAIHQSIYNAFKLLYPLPANSN